MTWNPCARCEAEDVPTAWTGRWVGVDRGVPLRKGVITTVSKYLCQRCWDQLEKKFGLYHHGSSRPLMCTRRARVSQESHEETADRVLRLIEDGGNKSE